MTSWQASKSGWGKWLVISLVAALTVTQLTHCGPKNKKNSAPSSASAVEATPEERNSAAVIDLLKIDELKFSSLEASTGRLSAKEVLKSLKEKKEVSHDVLAMALIELNLVAEGRSASADDQIKLRAQIAKWAEVIGAKKVEDLRAVYGFLEKANGSKMRHMNKAINLSSVLEKNEVHNYSAVGLLSLIWLSSMSTDASKGLVLFEEGEMKLAELRDGHLLAINPETLGGPAADLGVLKDFAAQPKKKVVSLRLYVIHEVLKKYVSDTKAWAVKIQKASDKMLGLSTAEEKLLMSASKDLGKAASALNVSELDIGLSKDSAEGELAEAVVPEKVLEKMTPKPLPAGSDISAVKENEAKVPSVANDKKNEEKKVDLAPAVIVNSDCLSRTDLQRRMAENEKQGAPMSGLTVQYLSYFADKAAVLGRTIIVARLSQLERLGLMAKITTLDPALATTIKESQVNGGRGFVDTALRVLIFQGQVVSTEILTQRAEGNDVESVTMASEVVDLLKKTTSELRIDDAGIIVSAEAVATCNVSGS